MGASFVSSRIVARIVAAAVACGADREDVCRASGVSPAELADVDGRLSPDVYLAVLRTARAHVTDPTLAFRAIDMRPGSYNLLRFLCGSSANLGEALTRGARYLRAETDVTSWEVVVEQDVSALHLVRHLPLSPLESQFADELSTADIVMLARDFTSRDISPARVRFAFAPPSDPRLHQEIFRCPIDFDAPVTELRWSNDVLALPLVAADEVAVAFFEHEIRKAISRGASLDLITRVRRELAARIKGDGARLDEVARAIGVSGRTLRRRLLAEGASFQALYDEGRFAYAKHCIGRGDVPLEAIAVALGFSEASAFHRAFRRWSGTTPQAFARTLRFGQSSA